MHRNLNELKEKYICIETVQVFKNITSLLKHSKCLQ